MTCANLPVTNFTPNNAQAMAQAMGMGTTCTSSSVADDAQAHANGLFSSVGASNDTEASQQSGCENQSLLYSAFQQATNTANCIMTAITNDESISTSHANFLTISNCPGTPGSTIPTQYGEIVCAPWQPLPEQTCLSQENGGTVNATLNVSSDVAQAITNATQTNLTQALSNMQKTVTGQGAEAEGGKSIEDITAELQTNTVNQNMYNNVNSLLTNVVQDNNLVLDCGGGCLPCIQQGNQVNVVAQNMVQSAINTAFNTAGVTTDVQNLTSAQTSESQGVPPPWWPSNNVGEIIGIILAAIIVIALLGFLGHTLMKGSGASPSSPSAKQAMMSMAQKGLVASGA